MSNETKGVEEALEKWGERAGVAELPTNFTICGCKGTVVTTEDGKRHIELECKGKKDRDDVAAIFEEEVILRVNPKVILAEPVEPAEPVAPVTES
ncbi:hypothetical protein ES703_86551 [subsurface metagenome]